MDTSIYRLCNTQFGLKIQNYFHFLHGQNTNLFGYYTSDKIVLELGFFLLCFRFSLVLELSLVHLNPLVGRPGLPGNAVESVAATLNSSKLWGLIDHNNTATSLDYIRRGSNRMFCNVKSCLSKHKHV